MKNKNQKQLARLIALQETLELQEAMTKKDKSKGKKSGGSGFGWILFIALMLATAYFTTGCSYHSECDQTLHGRGSIPASCRGVIYAGGK